MKSFIITLPKNATMATAIDEPSQTAQRHASSPDAATQQGGILLPSAVNGYGVNNASFGTDGRAL